MVARVYARTSVHAQMVTMDSDVQEEVGESRGGGVLQAPFWEGVGTFALQ